MEGYMANAKRYDVEVMAALEEELHACGVPSREASRQLLQRFAAKNYTAKKLQLGAKDFAEISLALHGEAFRVIFNKMGVHNEQRRAELINQVRGLRFRLRPMLTAALSSIRQSLPTRGKRGPIPLLNLEQRMTATSTIETLRNNGMTLKYAIETVSRDYTVTTRYMRNVYEQKIKP
jgi:hypothetical protein